MGQFSTLRYSFKQQWKQIANFSSPCSSYSLSSRPTRLWMAQFLFARGMATFRIMTIVPGSSNVLMEKRFIIQCPQNLVWSQEELTCDWSWRAPCQQQPHLAP